MRYFSKNQAEFPGSTGIYSMSFENSENNKFYIGSASKFNGKPYDIGFRHRWNRHLSKLRSNKHFSKKLQNAYNKYGEEFLYFEILEVCEPELCLDREQIYIDKYNACYLGYNSRPKASSQLGFKHSEESKQNQSFTKKEKRKAFYPEILELFNKGLNFKEIGEIINLDPHTVGKIFKEFGNIKPRNRAYYIKIKIFQYEMSGKFIKEFPSAYQAANELNISESSIRKVLKGQNVRANGFFFSYNLMSDDAAKSLIEDLYSEKRAKSRESRLLAMTPERIQKNREKAMGNNYRKKIENICQYDLDGNLIKIWNNSKEIVLHFKMKNFSPVLRVLNNKRFKFRGFRWSLLNQQSEN